MRIILILLLLIGTAQCASYSQTFDSSTVAHGSGSAITDYTESVKFDTHNDMQVQVQFFKGLFKAHIVANMGDGTPHLTGT